MKKYPTVILSLFALYIAPACGQAAIDTLFVGDGQRQEVTGGVMLEANRSGFIHSGLPGGRNLMKVGVGAGGFVNLGISNFFSTQGELFMLNKASDLSWGGYRGTYRYVGMEISIYAMFHYDLPLDNRIYIGIGPYTSFGLGASVTGNGNKLDVYAIDSETGHPPMYQNDYGFGIRIGHEIAGVQTNISYKVSMTSQLDPNTTKEVHMYPHMASIGIAYRFK